MPATDRSILLRGQRFHYTERGASGAPPVIMLHGITGHARTWDAEAEALVPRFRVLALDQRGHGDSDLASDGDYSIQAMAGDLAAFMDALALRTATLVGLSMGGRVAIAYAGAHRDRVERLMVVDIGPEIAEAGRDRVRATMAGSPERFETPEDAVAYLRQANPRYTDALLRGRVRHGLRALPDGGFAWKYDRAIREAIRDGRWRDSIDLWPLWSAIICPTVIVRGVESDVLSPAIVERMLAALPHARLVEVEGAGHTVPGDRPDVFLATLREFLAR